jgi:sugar lactone lactonase YvrE
VETQYLNDENLSEKDLASKVELFYKTPSTGGTAIDADGNIYVSDVNTSEIIKISPDGKESLVIKDKKLLWADALWINDDGYLWIPTGQLNSFGSISERKKQSEISSRDLQAENQCETIKKLNSVQDLN